MEFLDLKTQQNRIRKPLEKRISKILDHGAYIMGPEVFELEEKLADYCEVKHAISCSSGTDALLIPLMAWGVGPGDAIPGLSPHVTRIGIGYAPTESFSMALDTEYNSNQFYRGDENNHHGQKVPGYFLLNASAEFKFPLKANSPFSTVFFLDGRNLLDTNFETGGIVAENEVEGTGGSGTFVTPGQPLSIMGGMHIRW